MEELQATQEEMSRKSAETEEMLTVAENRTQLFSSLFNLAQEVVQCPSVEDAIKKALETACRITGCPVGHMYYFNDDSIEVTSSNHWYLQDLHQFGELKIMIDKSPWSDIHSIIHHVCQSKKPEVFSMEDSHVAYHARLNALQSGLKFNYVVPILYGKKCMGALEFLSEDQDVDLGFLEGVASLIGGFKKSEPQQSEEIDKGLDFKAILNHLPFGIAWKDDAISSFEMNEYLSSLINPEILNTIILPKTEGKDSVSVMLDIGEMFVARFPTRDLGNLSELLFVFYLPGTREADEKAKLRLAQLGERLKSISGKV
jgi:hypothetical protein